MARDISIRTMGSPLAFVAVLALASPCLAVSSGYAQNYAEQNYAQDDTPTSPSTTTDTTSASQDSSQGATPAPTRRGSEFSYSVRSGDSLGSIASTFGIQAEDIAHANRLELDTTLMVGQTLRI